MRDSKNTRDIQCFKKISKASLADVNVIYQLLNNGQLFGATMSSINSFSQPVWSADAITNAIAYRRTVRMLPMTLRDFKDYCCQFELL